MDTPLIHVKTLYLYRGHAFFCWDRKRAESGFHYHKMNNSLYNMPFPIQAINLGPGYDRRHNSAVPVHACADGRLFIHKEIIARMQVMRNVNN